MQKFSNIDKKDPMPISRTLAELEILWETPMSSEQLKSAHRAARAKIIHGALGLTQEQFAETYRVPQEMLLDWESGAVEPDARALSSKRSPASRKRRQRLCRGRTRSERTSSRAEGVAMQPPCDAAAPV